MNMKKLTVKQDSHAAAPYKVIRAVNTVEWRIGQRLRTDEIQKILDGLQVTVEIR